MSDARGAAASVEAKVFPWIRAYPEGVDWHQSFEPQPLWVLLDRAVADYPDSSCCNFLGRKLTFAEVGGLVDQIAAGLQGMGIGKGSHVGLMLPNSPTYIVFYFAILKTGAAVVNFNPLYTHEELAYQIRDSNTRLMITLDLKVLFDKVEKLIADGTLQRAVVASFPNLLPAAKAVLFRMFKSGELAAPSRSPVADKVIAESSLLTGGKPAPVEIDPTRDVAVLQYTGGTTGTPKGAMLTHANLYVNTLQVVSWAPDLEPGKESMLGVLPFFHVFAMTVVLNFSFAQAAEILIMPRFELRTALKLISRSRPTCMPGVPTLFNAIVHHDKLKDYDLSSLKFCLSGGAPLPVEIKQRFEQLTGCKLVEGYGLTEASPVVTSNPLVGPAKTGSIGLPLPATFVSLRSVDDPSRKVPPGEKGEICVKGPQVMLGYWQRPAETAAQFVDGWLRTGDVARMDEEGFLFIEDRIKDLIICSGFNVYPRRIEEAIYEHPAVAEVTVIGIKDEYRGEAPKAFIRLKSGAQATAADIMAHLEPKLSKIELPSEIEFRDELPKTLIGKLSKKELKAEEDAKLKTAG
ncbi:MAG: long-chain fatty acid--CoA ligase [Hyphomicrobiaceae bacterium]